MSISTNLVVSGETTLKQFYNALGRIGIKPLSSEQEILYMCKLKRTSSTHIPIELNGIRTSIFFVYYTNDKFNNEILPKLPKESRKFKGSTKPILLLSMDYTKLGINLLTQLGKELGGGYLQVSDSGNEKEVAYQLIKGK